MTGSALSLKIRNPWSWYAVTSSHDLQAGKIMQAVLNGENLVVWRSRDQRPSAWSDRCPHRGMRLSLGAAQGASLVCPYHGWSFAADGHCHHIPAHPKLSPSRAARARIYPVVEESGYVWVCLGEPSSSRPRPVTEMQPLRTIHLPVDADVAVAALLVCPLESGPSTGPACGPIAVEDAAWASAGGALVVTMVTDGEQKRRFTARVELPGQVSCEYDGDAGGRVRYRALIQPTEVDACAVHLATEPAAAPERKLALNRSLVTLRHGIGWISSAPAAVKALEEFGRTAQEPAQA
jgi:nitrite reductase/ring-hydroxylating ferredoxin subunit